jgi:hypothetical protein
MPHSAPFENNVFLFPVVLSCLIFGILILLLLWLRKLALLRTREVLNRFEGTKVLGVKSGANFFGLESLGMAQVRGNGVLVFTERELYFEMWIPKRVFRIPLASIEFVETPRSHLGKTKARPLLKVVFLNERGERDSMAWLVSDVYECKNALEELAKRAKQ